MRVFAVMLFLVLTAAPFFGAGIILHDGTIIQGKIVSTNKTELTLESQIGVIKIGNHQIKTVIYDAAASLEIAQTEFILATNAVGTFIKTGQFYSEQDVIKLQKYSLKFNDDQKLALYTSYEMKDWYVYSALNLFPFLSIGTWALGRWETALLTGMGELLFGALALSVSSPDLKVSMGLLAIAIYAFNGAYPAIYQWLRNEQIKIVLGMYPDRLHPSLNTGSMLPSLGIDGIALKAETMLFHIPVFTASF
ncbi:MAG: hypothetical protein A2Y33_08690 [Spirochaetes bacterium GWF1_51_8]|nr:MAG: hypothetical protein A2Y33_08690 [Spirochaetes bacterium GWF1_51_8]